MILLQPKLLAFLSRAKLTLLTGLFLLAGTWTCVFAQNVQRVRGVITDAGGVPLAEANITIKGTGTTTMSAGDGAYVIEIPSGKKTGILVFTHIGYEPQEFAIPATGILNVSLHSAAVELGDVVVVAYGTQKKVNLTGSVSTVSSKDLESRPVTTLTQALQGAAPNLIIQQNISEPGAAININIRGIGTLGNSSPLVIVDGIPGSLDALNPNDIESISILKDASSSAVYGSRAANGVILITTKNGKKNARTSIVYNGIAGWQMPTFQQKPVSAYEYAQLKNEALINSGQQPEFSPEQIKQFYDRGSYKWWLNEVIKPSAPQQNHNISVSAAAGNTAYLFSAGYVEQGSMYRGPDYGLKRYNLRSNIRTQVGDRLKLGSIISISRTDIREHAYYSQWIISTAARIPRIYPIKDSAGNYFIAPTASNNPLAQLEEGGLRTYQNDYVNLNLNAEFSITKHLSAKVVYGGDFYKNRLNEFRKSIDYTPYVGSDNQSSLTDGNTVSALTNFQGLLNYDQTFAEVHLVKALLGFSTESYSISNSQLQKLNVDNITGQPVIGTTINESGSYNLRTDKWALNSVFGRANYAFRNKYLFEFDFRIDGSSRFAKGNRNAFFPSVSVGWRITDEKPLESIREKYGNVKIRGSWGQLGNQEIGLYRYLNIWSTNPNVYGFNNQGQTGAYFSAGNRDIKWETSTMTDVGIDADLLKNKLTISWDYFSKMTTGILLNLPAPSLYGTTPPTQNAGKVKNQGWELAVSYKMKTGAFNHVFSANLADNLNTVVDVHHQVFLVEADRTFIIKEGFPINSYYGLQSNGFYQSQNEVNKEPKPTFVNDVQPGDIKYVDRNKDGKINNDDRYIMGNPFPRYTFGFNYSVSWKGFDVNVFVQGVGKRSLYLRGEGVEAFHNNWDDVYQQHLDRWTPTHPNATYPRLTIGTASTNNEAGSDFWLLNAAYARLKNVQIGYTIPAKITSPLHIQKCRIYFTGQNLFTMTKMNNGFDPEISELDNSLNINHSDINSGRVYPNLKVVAFGLDLNF